jgi:hypothetical protein
MHALTWKQSQDKLGALPQRKIVGSLFLPSPERTGLADLFHGLAHLTGVLEHV